MGNSNSFNICGRCGTANSLNAKYCYQCGSQLKAPEEPLVCHNCRAVNNGMANFCRTCGATLKVGAQTKICPRCRKEIPVERNQCTCGYSFATVRMAQPSVTPLPANPRTGEPYGMPARPAVAPAAPQTEIREEGKAKGRVAAIFSLLFALAFAYVLFAPMAYQLSFLKPLSAFVGAGVVLVPEEANPTFFEILLNSINVITGGGTLSAGMWVVMIVAGITALCLALHILVALIRIFTGNRPKKANVLYFILAVFTTLIAVFMILANSVDFVTSWYDNLFGVVRDASSSWNEPNYGWAVLAGYFIFFWLGSLIVKKRDVEI